MTGFDLGEVVPCGFEGAAQSVAIGFDLCERLLQLLLFELQPFDLQLESSGPVLGGGVAPACDNVGLGSHHGFEPTLRTLEPSPSERTNIVLFGERSGVDTEGLVGVDGLSDDVESTRRKPRERQEWTNWRRHVDSRLLVAVAAAGDVKGGLDRRTQLVEQISPDLGGLALLLSCAHRFECLTPTLDLQPLPCWPSHPLSTVTNVDSVALFDQPVLDRLVTHRASPKPTTGGSQRSFEDLGVPLHQVTFCVLDLETTGGNRNEDRITEIGAVKVRGGESLGTFQTMINPGIRIPAEITVLTGISQAMVVRAPRIEEVLPSLLEFIGDAVVVGHNVGFDTAFINAALERSRRPRLDNHVVDTLAVARRLLVDEVPNMKLGTLADRLRLPHQPTHRALDDALATADLLHFLFERAAFFGVLGLDDLLNLPTIDTHPQAQKLALTDELPRRPGVYMFHDRDGRILYIGKATNLRTRVRSYFSGDRRRKVAQLLRETDHISHIECPGPLEPEITEIRLIQQHQPRFNRVGKAPSKYAYLKLTLNEKYPRLSIITRPKDDGAIYLGPVRSRRTAAAAVDAIHSVTKLRRCTSKPASRAGAGPCATAQLGASACPCTGFTPEDEYNQITGQVASELVDYPDRILSRLADKMTALALAERFEEAAETRDRASALASILRRSQTFAKLLRARRMVVEVPGGGAEIVAGRLRSSWVAGSEMPLFAVSPTAPAAPSTNLGGCVDGAAADEMACVASWLDANAASIRLLELDGEWSSTTVALPRFSPAKGIQTKRGS